MTDPAFLFYSKDFQSGTQHMSCEEVGLYLRLLMFQHQNGKIPSDKERLMRISGIFTAEKFNELWEVVGQKFKQMDNHLVNHRLNQEMEQRATAKPKKIAAAVLAGLLSSNKALTADQRIGIKKAFEINDFIEFNTEEIKIEIKKWLTKWLTINANANANANANEDIKIDGENISENRIFENLISSNETYLRMMVENEGFLLKRCQYSGKSKKEVEEMAQLFLKKYDGSKNWVNCGAFVSHFTNWFNLEISKIPPKGTETTDERMKRERGDTSKRWNMTSSSDIPAMRAARLAELEAKNKQT